MSILLSVCSWIRYHICVGKVKLYSTLQSLDTTLTLNYCDANTYVFTPTYKIEPSFLRQKPKIHSRRTKLSCVYFKLVLSSLSLWKTLVWVSALRFSIFFKLPSLVCLALKDLSYNHDFYTLYNSRVLNNLPLNKPYRSALEGVAFFFVTNLARSSLAGLVSKRGSKQAGLRFFIINEENKLRAVLTSTFNEDRSKYATDTACNLVLTEVPAASLAAMFGYSRRYQKTPFVRFSLFKYFRRYFLILDQLTLDMAVRGVMRQFKSYFRTTNIPLNQIIKNPMTNTWIADFSYKIKNPKTSPYSTEEVSNSVRAVLEDSLLSVETTSMNLAPKSEEWSYLDQLTIDLTNFFLTQLSKVTFLPERRDVIIHRYRLTWEHIFFQKIVEHGFKKKKKARSIKKRRTKRLVKKTKYRFWNL